MWFKGFFLSIPSCRQQPNVLHEVALYGCAYWYLILYNLIVPLYQCFVCFLPRQLVVTVLCYLVIVVLTINAIFTVLDIVWITVKLVQCNISGSLIWLFEHGHHVFQRTMTNYQAALFPTLEHIADNQRIKLAIKICSF